MNVLVLDRPPLGRGAAARSSRAGRRAVWRWAFRLFRRDWRQQILVLALATLAVAAAVAGATIITNLAQTYEGQFGSARAAVRIDNNDPAEAALDLAAAEQ